MRNRHNFKWTVFAHDQRREPHGIFDHRRETARKTDDLHQAKTTADVDDAPEGIIPVRFPQLRIKSNLVQRSDHGPQRGDVGVDAQIEILGLPHVVMGRERHRSNHDCVKLMSRQNGENRFRGSQQIIGVTHTGVLAGFGLSQEKRAPMVSAAAIRSCTDRRLIRSCSLSRA